MSGGHLAASCCVSWPFLQFSPVVSRKRGSAQLGLLLSYDGSLLGLDENRDKMNSNQTPEDEYRCVCGTVFAVSEGRASTCPNCSRTIRRESLQATLGRTMYLSAKPRTRRDGSTEETVGLGQPDGSVDSGEELIGKRLGHFLLQECLGGGGMGTVYRALDTSLQRYVAVKVLHVSESGSTGSGSSSGPERLMHEAIAQARLNHPNVVTVYYVGREDEMPFLAMELLSDGTLEDRKEIPFRELIQMASQVSSALSQSHRQGVVHGDLKPSNLLVSDDGSIKLGDFGVAKISQADSQDEEGLSGTPSYLAPELLDGKRPSAQTDMYALGVTLFELTFGKLPYDFRGTTLQEKLETHRTAEPQFPNPWPNTFPPDWRQFLKRLMAKSSRRTIRIVRRSFDSAPRNTTGRWIASRTRRSHNCISDRYVRCVDVRDFRGRRFAGRFAGRLEVSTIGGLHRWAELERSLCRQ